MNPDLLHQRYLLPAPHRRVPDAASRQTAPPEQAARALPASRAPRSRTRGIRSRQPVERESRHRMITDLIPYLTMKDYGIEQLLGDLL